MHIHLRGRVVYPCAAVFMLAGVMMSVAPPAQAHGEQVKTLPTIPSLSGVTGTRLGLGTVVSSEGHILTSYHVVKGCSTVRFARSHEKQDLASVISVDENNDLALLKTTRRDLPAAALRVHPPAKVGETVQFAAVGSEAGALPTPLPLARGMTIAAVGPHNDARVFAFSGRLIGDTREVRPGDSGGPVLDEDGNFVGVITGTAAYDRRTGVTSLKGIGYVLQASLATTFLAAHGVPIRTVGELTDEKEALLAAKLDGIAPASGGDQQNADVKTTAPTITVRIWCTQPPPA